MKFILAPDSFKESMTAKEACAAMKTKTPYGVLSKLGSMAVAIACTGLAATAQQSNAQPLFQSSSFTAPNSFVSPEGPAVNNTGLLYAVNCMRKGTIGQITPEGKADIFLELPNRGIGNGIRFSKSGDMFIADYVNHAILKVDMVTRQLRVWAQEPKMSQPNDIAIDKKNRLYASDPDFKKGTGKIWRIDTDGKVVLLDSTLGTANGIELSPDDKILYVNETVQRNVWAYDLSKDGTISHKRLLIAFPDFGMDGMRCDKKGNLYITRHGKGTVVKVSPKGEVIREIKLNGKAPTNLAFGGKDGRTVYVTVKDNGNIECFLADIPGREWQMLKKK